MKTRWTIVSRDSEGDWLDESDDFSTESAAMAEAKKLASTTASNTYSVIKHETRAIYTRSRGAIDVTDD